MQQTALVKENWYQGKNRPYILGQCWQTPLAINELSKGNRRLHSYFVDLRWNPSFQCNYPIQAAILNVFSSYRLSLHGLWRPSAYIDRNQTNERMCQVYGCKFPHFSNRWKYEKWKLFGHILRPDRADPLSFSDCICKGWTSPQRKRS